MRISDWSSDVCSSDLWAGASTPAGARAHPAPRLADRSALAGGALSLPGTGRTARADARARGVPEFLVGGAQRFVRRAGPGAGDAGGQEPLADPACWESGA